MQSPFPVLAFSRLSGLVVLGLPIALQLSDRSLYVNALDVTWISPAAGDVYGPGAYILGEWQGGTEVKSPSFQLCMDDGDTPDTQDANDSCGSAVQPDVQQDSDTGAYQITL